MPVVRSRLQETARALSSILALLLLVLPFATAQSQTLHETDALSPEALLDALDRAIRDGTFRDINSLIVFSDGELLVERYYNGASRNQRHNPRSVGKTFAATVLGIAIDEGYIDGVHQTLSDFYDLEDYDNYSEKKAAVTLEELLTMTSGFEGFDFERDSIGNEENMYPQDDWVRWALNLPMAADREPGDAWRYFTAGVVILGDILHNAVPGGLEAYADEKFFKPLGISNYRWQHTPQGVANTAGGIQLTPLGFARYGQLHKARGVWEGEQVVPAAWVDEMLKPECQRPWPTIPTATSGGTRPTR